ncbi:RraA family protein [Mycolicibacterium komossense]|uniref:Putative 4-hydroxy-4-methyl-2-oxoglutarate aldolase n=1 Tax=Mycolicibacterium komossense TaxID=1779 RepID=A0ABT3CD35_9MYCO|nr:RraA family protein [Mycolicibacterium komossense]MCV7227322.1 RraA family protein [Mycolicibacterium komossense]
MPITLNPGPSQVDGALLDKLERVSFPTLGHYLEEGFVDPALVRLAGSGRVVGRAVTVRTTATDSTMLHHAVGYLEPGDVLVIDTGGDRRHAPVGLVIAAAAAARGARGIVVDGVVTDIDEIAEIGIPVHAYGLSMLTTKLQGIDAGGHHVGVVVGGVSIAPGDVVLADANGVFAAGASVLAAIIDIALQDDAEEPELIERVRAGARLGDETGATTTIMSLPGA